MHTSCGSDRGRLAGSQAGPPLVVCRQAWWACCPESGGQSSSPLVTPDPRGLRSSSAGRAHAYTHTGTQTHTHAHARWQLAQRTLLLPASGSSSLTLQKGLQAWVRPYMLTWPVLAAPLSLLNTKTRARLPRTRSGPWSLPPAPLPSSRPSSPAVSERREEGQRRVQTRAVVPWRHLPGRVGRPRSMQRALSLQHPLLPPPHALALGHLGAGWQDGPSDPIPSLTEAPTSPRPPPCLLAQTRATLGWLSRCTPVMTRARVTRLDPEGKPLAHTAAPGQPPETWAWASVTFRRQIFPALGASSSLAPSLLPPWAVTLS